jgi:hypothetical protein
MARHYPRTPPELAARVPEHAVDAEGKCEDGDGCESGGFAEHAEGVVNVLGEVLNPVYAATIAALFLTLFNSAHFDECLAASFFRRQTFGDVLLGLSLDMIPQFVVKFLVRFSSAK